MDLHDKDILVLGLGITGRSAARFCAERGARVVAVDERAPGELGDLSELEGCAELRTGAAFPPSAGFDIVVPSPGIARGRYAEGALHVWGDIELAGRALEIPVVAVTGTNGKSTTVLMIEAMLKACGLRARAAGNLGEPALSLVGAPLDVAVLEVSSFQLEAVEAFRPRVAVILNLSPDHLDRHGSFEAYADAKGRLLDAQESDDTAVLNFGDAAVRALAARTRAHVVPFSTTQPLAAGVSLDAGAVLLRTGNETLRLSLDDLQLPGPHNRENLLAAIAAVHALGVDPQHALRALTDFRGLPHRSELVATRAGVSFINDSKATNPGAAIQALQSFARPVVWIAGGSDKGVPFDELAGVAVVHARSAVLIGETAGRIEAAIARRIPVERAASLDEAVSIAAASAREGDVVLLSPGCASFDAFAGFAERGDRFRDAVAALDGEGARP